MCENNILYGAPQRCPKCKMYNVAGLKLPEACAHCKGTGRVDLGIKLTNQPVESDGATSAGPATKYGKMLHRATQTGFYD